MKYLRATKDVPLTLESGGSGQIQWWLDLTFSVHSKMRRHMGDMAVSASKKKIRDKNINQGKNGGSRQHDANDCLGEIFP